MSDQAVSDAIDTLIAVCRAHPDYSGELTTRDIPQSILARAYAELQQSGDDLSDLAGAVGVFAAKRGSDTLMVVPLKGGGWQVRMVSDSQPSIEWPHPTPPEYEARIREMVGGRVSEMRRLRSAIEDVWRERCRDRDRENQQRLGGPWEVAPDRMDDEVLMEAMLRYQKG